MISLVEAQQSRPTSAYFPPLFLTPFVSVDVLLADEEQASVKGGEHEAVIPGLPEELDVGGVGQAWNGDAVAVLGWRTERLGHLPLTHAPEGRHEGHSAEEERHDCLEEGEGWGTHPLQECHHARLKWGLGLMGESGWKCEFLTSIKIWASSFKYKSVG